MATSSDAAAAKPPAATAPPNEFEFIVGDRPDQLKAGSSKKLRSHLSKRGWQVYLLQHNSRSSSATAANAAEAADAAAQQREDRARRKRRKRLQHTVTWEVRGPEDPGYPGTADAFAITNGQILIQGRPGGGALSVQSALSIDYQLGGGRVDPFRSYPVSWAPYIPHLVDHCKLTCDVC